MTESLLRYLVEITGHRDQNLLDLSVVSALHELVGATEARVLEMVQFNGDTLVRPRVWIKSGKVASVEENQNSDTTGEPLTDYPSLLTCIEQRKTRFEEQTADGRQVLWIPVWQNDKMAACLQIVNHTPYTPHMLHVMEGILSVYRNYQSLLDYSERDSLTGLLNRKTFDEKFSRMVSMVAPETEPPADKPERRQYNEANSHWLAVVDIDHFKRVNDQFGHLYGDEVLILVANALRSSFRSQDRVFRFGGEEFVILLRSATLSDAKKIFDRFRHSIEQQIFPQVGQVTVSIGFAGISHETPVVILGRADQALYYAKEHGRNQVCYYDNLIDGGLLHAEKAPESVEFFFDDISPCPEQEIR
jgi:diguanylate cyclase (GGDEF)-like protein